MVDHPVFSNATNGRTSSPDSTHGVRTTRRGSHMPRGPPPPLPTTPKPKTAVTREITYQNNPSRPKTCHHGFTPSTATSCLMGNPQSGNRLICRRHTEKHKRKLTGIPQVSNRQSPGNIRNDTSCLPALNDSRFSMNVSPSCEFIRNSPVRKATRRVFSRTSNATRTIAKLDKQLIIRTHPPEGARKGRRHGGEPLTRLLHRLMLG